MKNKRTYRLTENKLRGMIREAVKGMLSEVSDNTLLNAHNKAWREENPMTPQGQRRNRQKDTFGNELDRRFKKQFMDTVDNRFPNDMSEDEIRQTDAYKAAYNELDSWDFYSYPERLGDTWGEEEIISDVVEMTRVPEHVVAIALEDFKNDNPELVEMGNNFDESLNRRISRIVKESIRRYLH